MIESIIESQVMGISDQMKTDWLHVQYWFLNMSHRLYMKEVSWTVGMIQILITLIKYFIFKVNKISIRTHSGSERRSFLNSIKILNF